ncbi:MAG: dTDP-glucose 4,6-dehydratase [Candidatus Omnitrophica bacterium]|nr:dTDP-glucose 4,6-dehydratase [Candidatus Omnitrophota bacterium]
MRGSIRKILVTGGAGFIGSEFVRQAVLQKYKVIVVDALTYAGRKERLKDVLKDISFYKINICNASVLKSVFAKERPDEIIHFAAETHVDRSILDAQPFLQTNILGTYNLITLSKEFNIKKFIHISTDEVYGQSLTGFFKESSPLEPRNFYSATKASAEHLVHAAILTHDFPATIVRPSNNYGPWQYPEKFLPVVISKILKNQPIPVYGKGEQIREWLYVKDCADGILTILKKGALKEIYNIGSNFEKKNLETAKTILKLMGKSERLIKFVKDRPGHDFRYSIDCSKIRKLGWQPKTSFEDGIKETILWYTNNQAWLKKL